MGPTCYLLCVFLHKTLKYSADKTLIGWSESHHGNYARELSMNAAHWSSHTLTNAKWTCDRLRVSRPIRICPQKGTAEASVVCDSDAHQPWGPKTQLCLFDHIVCFEPALTDLWRFGDTCFKCSGTLLKTHLKVKISQNLIRFESFSDDHIICCVKPWTYPRSQQFCQVGLMWALIPICLQQKGSTLHWSSGYMLVYYDKLYIQPVTFNELEKPNYRLSSCCLLPT